MTQCVDIPDMPVRLPRLGVRVDGVVGPDAEVPQLQRPRVVVQGAQERHGVLCRVAPLVLVTAEHAHLHRAAVRVPIREMLYVSNRKDDYVIAGLGSILDTVSKDTEDTAPFVPVSVS